MKRSLGFIPVLLIVCFALQGIAETAIAPDLFLAKNQEKTVVIGTYSLPQGMDYAEANALGFNLIRSSADQTLLDSIHEAGLSAWVSFGKSMDFGSGDAEKKRASILATVQRFSGHPAILFWESMDEPAWTDKQPAAARAAPAGLARGYQFLKSLDPTRPVYMNHAPRNTIQTLQTYNDACDIVCVDIYPVIPKALPTAYGLTRDGRHGDLPNQTPSCVGEYVDKMKAVANGSKPVFIVLQGFSWGVTVAEPRRKNYLLYPSYEETRFMAFQSIIHGAKGILYFGLHHTPKDHPFIGELGKVLDEIRGLSSVILNGATLDPPEFTYHERGSTIAKGVEALVKKTADGFYLITANTSLDPAAADVKLPKAFSAIARLEALGEGRSVAVKNGSFFDEWNGLGVHVYRAR